MPYKALNRFKKNKQFAEHFRLISELFTELETSIESCPIEDETKVFEALDTLEEDLDDLSYLIEDTTNDNPLRGSNFLKAELPEALRILIAGFRPFKIDDFKAHCQNLINVHGFSKFREAFDALFLHDEHLNKREMRAIKHINRYLMNRMMDTFAAITAEGSKTYAQGILDVLDKPDEFFREKALAAATKDKFQKAKNLAIKTIEIETVEKIVKIEKQKLPKEELEKAIEHIKEESSKQITAIEQRETLPLDYYIEAERRKMLVEAQRARALFQSYDKVADFVLNDILAKKTMDERTVTVERYLLMAEKLIARKNFDAALQIYAAVQKTPVFRLAKTKEGLSTHAQEVLENLGNLLNNSGNFLTLRSRCEQENACVPLNFTVTDITFITDEKNSFALDSQGNIVKGCKGLPGMDKTIGNCLKALETSQSHLPDYMLLEEINRNQVELASKTQKEIDKEHDKISQELEPRGNPPESSTLLAKVKYKKIIRLGAIDPPKRSEQHHKLEELIHNLKHGIQTQLTRLKNIFVKTETSKASRTSSILEEMQDGVTSLFDKVSSFFHDKLKSLTHSSKLNKEAFFQIKDEWTFANEDDENRDDEYPSL